MKRKICITTAAAVLIITALLCACTPVPVNGEYDVTRGVTGARGETEFTLVSYNIHGGGSSRALMQSITEQIDESGADVANLQEVDSDDSPRGEGGYVSILTGGNLKESFFSPTMTREFGDYYGLMTASKYKADDTLSLFLPYPGENYKLGIEPRIVTRYLVTIGGVQIAVYNTHLDFTDEQLNGNLLRLEQMKFIIELMDSDPCPYKVLSGDFNVADMDEFSVFGESGKYAMLVTPSNPLPTFRSGDGKESSIDNIIYTSDTMELTKGGVTRSDYSDHFMLYATFKTK